MAPGHLPFFWPRPIVCVSLDPGVSGSFPLQTPTVVHNGWAIQRIRQFYTRTSRLRRRARTFSDLNLTFTITPFVFCIQGR